MAYSAHFGTGLLGNVTNPTGQINSYALVDSVVGNSISVSNISYGAYETFAPYTEIMFHVTGAKTSEYTYLGAYFFTCIKSKNGNTWDLADNPRSWLLGIDFSKYWCQVISVANFANLTISSVTSMSPNYLSATTKVGGISVVRVSGTLSNSVAGGLNCTGKGSQSLWAISNPQVRPAGITMSNSTLATRLLLSGPYPDDANSQAGGGVLYLAANTISAGSVKLIQTDGVTFNGNWSGGGGPGGTAIVAAATITGFTTSFISSLGGTGGVSGSGGVGGTSGGGKGANSSDSVNGIGGDNGYGGHYGAKNYGGGGSGGFCYIATNTTGLSTNAAYTIDTAFSTFACPIWAAYQGLITEWRPRQEPRKFVAYSPAAMLGGSY